MNGASSNLPKNKTFALLAHQGLHSPGGGIAIE
jgi:hypothetical protein